MILRTIMTPNDSIESGIAANPIGLLSLTILKSWGGGVNNNSWQA
jgi:hypothetical protein